jgi:hypothetical protein
MNLTRRGHIAIWVVALLIAALFTVATRDVCYVGNGFGSCSKMVDQVGTK